MDQTSRNFTANNMNLYSAIDGTRTLTYDLSGNMTNNGLNNTYSYDSENRLMSATMGSDFVEYDYDPFGRRVLKDIDEGETVTRYVYDGPHGITEYSR